jgi:hypothetical protein
MSTSYFRSTAAAAVVGVGALAFLGTPASAQTCYPPTTDCATTTSSTPTTGPTLVLSATVVARGQTISATVAGFQPGTSGILTIASVEQQIGSFTMPASGATVSSITIPSAISLGAHTIFARGTAAGGQVGSASRGITVVAAGSVLDTSGSTGTTSGSSSGSTLARTGVFWLLGATVVGGGLVAGGIALQRSGRRKAGSAG